MKKRFAAALLSVCLAFGLCAGAVPPVYGAAEARTQDRISESALEIEVSSMSGFPYEGEVAVKVSGKDGFQQEHSLKVEKGAAAAVRIPVPAGEYTIQLNAEKFAGYTQTIQVQAGWTHRIQVCPSKVSNGSLAVPGWMRPGDVNGDGDISEVDSQALLEAVRAERTDTVYDLNGDGQTDLADLDMLVQSIYEKQESAVEQLWVPDSKYVQTEDGTTVEGAATLEALLLGQGVVRLQNAQGKPVSEQNPLTFAVTLAEGAGQGPMLSGMTIQAPDDRADADGRVASQISRGTVTIEYTDSDGAQRTQEIALDTEQGQAALAAKSSRTSVFTEADGSIVLDFGGQIAVKRISIRITGTKKEQPFAEIARVTFVNDMENRIPAPQLDIPSITSVTPGSKKLSVTWKAQKNVTGYELQVSGPVKNQSQTQILAAVDTSYEIMSINQQELVNYKEYTIRVRSVNGSWRSPWSEAVTATPLPQSKPAPPDYVRAQGGYRAITVSWKAMDDADGYMVYYKESNAAQYQPAVSGFVQTKEGTGRLRTNSYTITGLKEHVSYSVYVVSWNAFGWGRPSSSSQTYTRSEAVPVLPAYKLLNTSNGPGQRTAHIADAVIGGSGGACMKSSPLDTEKNSGLGLVDDDYASYWSKEDWDDGVSYVDTNQTKGMTITLDAEYQMNYFTFAAADQKAGFETVRIQYWDKADTKNAKTVGARLLQKYDVNQNPYYIVKLDETIRAEKVKMCLGRASLRAEMKVGEIRFYVYDSLEDDIMALYQDEMHTTLKDSVTMQTVQELKNRLELTDEKSGEKHPLYTELALEIQTAEEILTTGLDPSYEVNPMIRAQKDGHLGFGGLNAWQPLGKAARAGDTLLVYVGHHTKRTGDAAQLALVFTQHYAEASSVAKTVSLKVGRNILTVPQLSDKETERGGQLYIAYTGSSDADQYAVRISGASSIPVLRVDGKTGQERTQAVRDYIEKLESHTAALQTEHDSVHTPAELTYDKKYCILNATDIQMEQMMYSLPATQVLDSLGGAQSLEAKTAQLERALEAMEQMMTLFYQHKGLSSQAGGKNALPSQHLNIRYMRMFAGAFMYAAGNHIGIEWGSTQLTGVKDWTGFGWGIAHEIGHNINQGTYAIAEITNNYYAQLMKKIADGRTRFDYTDVYRKVTSGTLGRSSNVMIQLAMYWQLHLAYSNEKDDSRIYEDYNEQLDHLFFARVDTYARNPAEAPQGGVVLDGDAEQNLMRLACAAAQKNLLAFFERWGMVPDETTSAYARKFPEETKAIYYINDEVRNYRIDKKNQEADSTIQGKAAIKASVKAEGSQVSVSITADAGKEQIFGYEIIRSMQNDGKKKEEIAGFQLIDPKAPQTVFIDRICTVNNRVLSYEVRAVDKYLNYSDKTLAGSVKIETDAELDKTGWTVTTNMSSEDDKIIASQEENPDSGYDASDFKTVEPARVNSIERIMDNDKTTTEGFYQEAADRALPTAQITIDLHKTREVTALKYLGREVSALTIEISEDGQNWKAVKTEDTGLKNADDTKELIVWFDAVQEAEREKWIGTYEARYLRLTLTKSGPAAIREITLCGPSGDNLEFFASDSGNPAVGKLREDYIYGTSSEDVIPKGSLVFAGSYKGNPAYNAVLLYDTQGNVIGEKDGEVQAEQVIFAAEPKNGNLGETSDGSWIYYVEPGQWDENTLQNIEGVRGELYRVDEAGTMKGERIVSDTQIMRMPQTLPEITLTGSVLPGM